ncbi:MAG: 30S ribosomal protein S19e [Candidatus Heimdallarchaeota archaeon]|nr:30S ribosomal protein S19e [Candidatus Heimdallarchaeota archaeon]
MPTVYDVPAEDLITALSAELKKSNKISPPEWSSYVKTGSFKQHAPQNPDWWYVRCASLLRKVYVKGPIGIGHLRKEYGGIKHGNSGPEKFSRSGGAIIRKALQQLESEGLITSSRFGRSISPKGKSVVDKLSTNIIKEKYPELKQY